MTRDGRSVAERTEKSILATGRAAARGVLPPRYGTDFWDQRFKQEIEATLEPGMRILDVGGGAQATIPVDLRPPGCTYVGLDILGSELEKDAGSYDEFVVADIVEHRPELDEGFDLVVSWFVLEHVRPIDTALENMRRYLKPGGRLIAQLAGGRSPSGLANRAIPHWLAKRLLKLFLGENPDRVFPAYYDRCRQSALAAILSRGWSNVRIMPLHTGAEYVRFSRPLMGLFVTYEEWAFRHDRGDLATYYLIAATREGAPG